MIQQNRNGIKLLAEQAKRRLARNGRVSTGVANTTCGTITKVRYIQEKVLLNDEEEELLYHKIKEIFSSTDTITNPIGQLIDQTKFKTLNAIERDAYIVKMVEKFQKLKQRLETEKLHTEHLKIS